MSEKYPRQTERGRGKWPVAVFAVAVSSVACVKAKPSDLPFPSMDRQAAMELSERCGTRSDPFRDCPALEAWLADVLAVCGD